MLNRSIFVEDTPEAFHETMRAYQPAKHLDIATAYAAIPEITATVNDNLEHLTDPQHQNLNQVNALYTQATTILEDLHDALTTLITSITGTQPGHYTPHPAKPVALTGSLLGKTCYLASPNGEGITGEVITLDTTHPGRDEDDDWDDDEPAQYIVLKVPVSLDVPA